MSNVSEPLIIPPGDYPVKIAKYPNAQGIAELIITKGPRKGRKVFAPFHMLSKLKLVASIETKSDGDKGYYNSVTNVVRKVKRKK